MYTHRMTLPHRALCLAHMCTCLPLSLIVHLCLFLILYCSDTVVVQASFMRRRVTGARLRRSGLRRFLQKKKKEGYSFGMLSGAPS